MASLDRQRIMRTITSVHWRTLMLLVLWMSLSVWLQHTITLAIRHDFSITQPDGVHGFYGREYSEEVPNGNTVRATWYQWSGPNAQLDLWPAIGSMRIGVLQYVAPFSTIRISDTARTYVVIPQSTTIRTAKWLLSDDASGNVYFYAKQAAKIDQRRLGFMMIDLQWQSLTNTSWTSVKLWSGIPFTAITGFILSYAIWRQWWYRQLSIITLMGALAVAGIWWPWQILALQPTIQFMLLVGIATYVVMMIWRRRLDVASPWTPHRILLAVWLVSVLVFYQPVIQSDGAGYYAFVRSAFIDGDIDFRNDFELHLPPPPSSHGVESNSSHCLGLPILAHQ